MLVTYFSTVELVVFFSTVEKYVSEDAFSLNFPKITSQETKTPKDTVSSVKIDIEPVKEVKVPTGVSVQEEKIEKKLDNKVVPDYKIIGEAFNSYVIVELGDIMYLIDKHAAHERIIFEDLKNKIKSATPSSQMLLVPIEVKLNASELSALYEWEKEIGNMGFGYQLKDDKVSIFEIPSEIEVAGAEDSFATLISRLVTNVGYAEISRYDFFEKALYQASCKAAIKAGRIYDREHIKWICDRVLTLDNIKYCPHGRPIAFEITKHFLEKQFERIK